MKISVAACSDVLSVLIQSVVNLLALQFVPGCRAERGSEAHSRICLRFAPSQLKVGDHDKVLKWRCAGAEDGKAFLLRLSCFQCPSSLRIDFLST